MRNVLWLTVYLVLILLGFPVGSSLEELTTALESLARGSTEHHETKNKDETSNVKIIPAAEYFEYLMGQPEKVFKNNRNVTISYDARNESYRVVPKKNATGPFVQEANGDFSITNPKIGVKYNAGQFTTYTHQTFKAEPEFTKKNGTFNVVEIYWSLGAWLQLQYEAAIRGEKAAFLAASNYDGIEEMSGEDDPTVASNLGDPTQGPAASLGALPGMLLRFYSQIREGKEVLTNKFDDKNPRVHMLKMTGLNTQNGYVYFTDHLMPGTETKLPKDLEEGTPDKENFESFLRRASYSCGIMYHKNISVTASNSVASSSRFENFSVPAPLPTNTIDQIFAAGLSLGQYRNTLIQEFTKNKVWIEAFADLLAQKIMEDIIALSIRATVKNNAEVLYLLPIGCGVFGNKHLWLGRALKKAKDLIVGSGLTINFVFGPNYYRYETPDEYNTFMTTLKNLVQETGGSYTAL
ncbi:MAG: hypothetical protein M1549_01130 [Candidatus Dependentiae bacterium]|nr:hypothetical protein [Candidatus Dependentiae bacterium]